MEQIITAQGKQTTQFELGTLTRDIAAPADGTVIEINNLSLARIARLAGAPIDKGAGVYLFKRIGDKVSKGEPLYRIYSQFPADFQFACNFAEKTTGFRLGKAEEQQFTW